MHALIFCWLFKQVLIFSQWTKILDIMDYYFSEKGFEVCRIDGSVKLDERKKQVRYTLPSFFLNLKV
jgi:SNF2 family DNA or RNA helicase